MKPDLYSIRFIQKAIQLFAFNTDPKLAQFHKMRIGPILGMRGQHRDPRIIARYKYGFVMPYASVENSGSHRISISTVVAHPTHGLGRIFLSSQIPDREIIVFQTVKAFGYSYRWLTSCF